MRIVGGEEQHVVRADLVQHALDQGVTFIKTNITDEQAVLSAFSQPWASSVADLGATTT